VSIFTLVASLVGSTMINEAFWQRVWASADTRTLHGGAVIGYSAVVLLIFLSGFGGWLAFAGGYAVEGVTNANVYLMQVRCGACSGCRRCTKVTSTLSLCEV
jgi:hypothetical protein